MSDLQDELDAIGPLIEGDYGVMVSKDSPIVEAARRVANLDMEAAARFYSAEVGRRSGSKLTWEAMYEEEQADFLRVSTGAVNAALGVTEDE